MVQEDKSLYEVLGVEKDATQADIKKAYLKLALKLHPDKNPGDEEAKNKFQSLQRIYAVIGDPQKRKVYDQTGSLEDSEGLAGEQFDNLYEYYRNIYKKVSEEDIEQVEGEYRGSAEERRDLLGYYKQFKGDMDKVFEWVMCSDAKRDSHRFMDLVQEAISQGEAKRFKAFSAWAKEVSKKPAPKDPLGPRPMKRKAKADEQSLVAAIRSKAGSSMNALAAALEAKYGNGNHAQHQDAHEEEPTEEEFQAAAARMKADKKKTSKKGKAGRAKSNGVTGSSMEQQDLPEEPTEEEFAEAAARLKVERKSSRVDKADDDAKRTAKPKNNKKRKANAE